MKWKFNVPINTAYMYTYTINWRILYNVSIEDTAEYEINSSKIYRVKELLSLSLSLKIFRIWQVCCIPLHSKGDGITWGFTNYDREFIILKTWHQWSHFIKWSFGLKITMAVDIFSYLKKNVRFLIFFDNKMKVHNVWRHV